MMNQDTQGGWSPGWTRYEWKNRENEDLEGKTEVNSVKPTREWMARAK